MFNDIPLYKVVHLTSRHKENFYGHWYPTEPAAPANLKADLSQSQGEVIITWNPVTNNCTPVEYSILTVNCGNCPSNMTISVNNFSCGSIVPGRKCKISVQVLEQCEVSDPTSLSIDGKSNLKPQVINKS